MSEIKVGTPEYIGTDKVSKLFKLEALCNNVILKMLPKITRKGAILLSSKAEEDSDFCEVVDIGPDTMRLEVGQKVLRPNPAEVEYIDEDDGGQVYLIVPESSVSCRVRVR
jgi:co-chaperonin GroES (HSP10)